MDLNKKMENIQKAHLAPELIQGYLQLNKKLKNEQQLMDYFKMDFRDIENYEEHYATNIYGNIWSYKSQKFLAWSLGTCCGKLAYYKVGLCKDNKKETIRIHTILAKAYIYNDNPEVNVIVGHEDDDKTNLLLSNLYWTTHQENSVHNDINKRIQRKTIPVVCVETGEIFKSIDEAGRWVNRNHSTMRAAIDKPTRTAGGYHWVSII